MAFSPSPAAHNPGGTATLPNYGIFKHNMYGCAAVLLPWQCSWTVQVIESRLWGDTILSYIAAQRS